MLRLALDSRALYLMCRHQGATTNASRDNSDYSNGPHFVAEKTNTVSHGVYLNAFIYLSFIYLSLLPPMPMSNSIDLFFLSSTYVQVRVDGV